MDIIEADTLALTLMNKYKLLNKGWIFEFNNSKVTFGLCKCYLKTICLSKSITELNEKYDVNDVILHEIAHALDFEKRGTTDHGRKWKKIAKQIGCKPETYCDDTVVYPKAKYTANCPNCNKEFSNHRKPKKYRACGHCCKKYNNNKWSEKYGLIFKKNY